MLRPLIRAAREARPRRERERAGEAFARNAVEAVGDAQFVAAYVSRPTEPSTFPLLEALRDRGTRVLLPVLGPGLCREWALYTGPDDLEVRAPGRPPEPSGPVLPSEAVGDADVVIAPALAIDSVGTRLGQGGGWYDRVLPLVRQDAHVFAMVYDEELIADVLLPVDEHDMPVPAVITPTEWFLLEGSAFQQDAARRRTPA
ncbi:5-formyltetrahydrofolate cyclo-ligase [Georgenia alba]|uniref:5-formyltetrahydrofolate cyclo-ligase n=1 Tax=Georgenia alba TaxID=2233858 RepID=A0ABW2Q5P3_9MICO